MLAFISKFGSRRNQTLIFPLKFNPKITFPPQNPFLIRPISSKSHLSNPGNANSVSKVLRDYGFTHSNIATAVGRMPALLSFHPDKNLRPKMEFLQQHVGLSGKSLVQSVVRHPWFLRWSLKNAMIPSLEILMGFLNSKEDVLSALKRNPALLGIYNTRVVSTNMEFLKSQGVSDSNARRLLIKQPRSLIVDPVRFAEVFKNLKSASASLSGVMFLHALHVKVTMSAAKWDMKVAVYKEFGWSDSDILLAFKTCPYLLSLSTEKIRRSLDFTMNKLKMSPACLCTYPALLNFSLEKTLVPRCAVLGLLISNDVSKKEINVYSALARSNALFKRNYVSKYEKVLPAILQAYEGNIEFVGFDNMELVKAEK